MVAIMRVSQRFASAGYPGVSGAGEDGALACKANLYGKPLGKS
jgi:hypothetical protein